MKKRIHHFIALAFLLFTSIHTGQAQDQTGKPKMSAEQRTDKRVVAMRKKLNLSDEQVAKMKPLILAQEKIRESNMKEARESHQKMMSEMEKILSPEQMDKFKALQQERKDERKELRKKERKQHQE